MIEKEERQNQTIVKEEKKVVKGLNQSVNEDALWLMLVMRKTRDIVFVARICRLNE